MSQVFFADPGSRGNTSMFEPLKQNWESFKRGRAGSRFEEQYKRQQESHPSTAGRVLRVSLGVVILLVGLVLMPAPGPGFIVVGIGALMIAREFEFAAILLDHIEVRARRVLKWLKRTWRRERTAGR